MRYNAGSEVYTQTLSQGLADRHEVHVFTRFDDPFQPDYTLIQDHDPDDCRILLHLVNMPRSRDRYRHPGVDRQFASVLENVQPHVVHVGHLNHLSTSLVNEAAARAIPVVYTLHDYWLMCPRGQFMQMHPADSADHWAACKGQQDRRCAERCYARYFSGAEEEREIDVAHWMDWVARRMKHIRDVVELVDLFIAPARYLLSRYRDGFGIPERKLVHLDYGFDLQRMCGRRRTPAEPFTFGYIGTHIPAKGIHQLLDAFGQVPGNPRLRIWGRPRGENTSALQARAASLPGSAGSRVEWLPEYRNQDIIPEVFNRVDAIVVPSVWVENSPLVIHEAQQARVPVITADVGGMAELIRDGDNGLLFRHRDPKSLAQCMTRMLREPEAAAALGASGYLGSSSGDVPDIKFHVREVERLYNRVIGLATTARVKAQPAPWRITFDTNPDDCNLNCLMCEQHSPLQQEGGNGNSRKHRRMPFDLVRSVVEECRGQGLREIIPSTMGEPLLYPRFDDLIELCATEGIKLNLTTNGTFPGRGAMDWAEQFVPVTSDVKVSWNGATPETQERIMVGSCFEEKLESLRQVLAVRDAHAMKNGSRCRVTLQMTFLELNVDELPALVRLAAELGVDRLKGHHVWTHFPELEAISMRRDAEAIQRWNGAVRGARQAAEQHRLPSGGKILLDNIFPLFDDLEQAKEELLG